MKLGYNIIFILLIIIFSSLISAYSNKHLYKEKEYQHAWCTANNGIEEFRNPDLTRVDCLTETHAVEFDFAEKWAESIGQSLYYQYLTGKKAKVVLILEHPEKQYKYFERASKLSKIYHFDIEYVTPLIFK